METNKISTAADEANIILCLGLSDVLRQYDANWLKNTKAVFRDGTGRFASKAKGVTDADALKQQVNDLMFSPGGTSGAPPASPGFLEGVFELSSSVQDNVKQVLGLMRNPEASSKIGLGGTKMVGQSVLDVMTRAGIHEYVQTHEPEISKKIGDAYGNSADYIARALRKGHSIPVPQNLSPEEKTRFAIVRYAALQSEFDKSVKKNESDRKKKELLGKLARAAIPVAVSFGLAFGTEIAMSYLLREQISVALAATSAAVGEAVSLLVDKVLDDNKIDNPSFKFGAQVVAGIATGSLVHRGAHLLGDFHTAAASNKVIGRSLDDLSGRSPDVADMVQPKVPDTSAPPVVPPSSAEVILDTPEKITPPRSISTLLKAGDVAEIKELVKGLKSEKLSGDFLKRKLYEHAQELADKTSLTYEEIRAAAKERAGDMAGTLKMAEWQLPTGEWTEPALNSLDELHSKVYSYKTGKRELIENSKFRVANALNQPVLDMTRGKIDIGPQGQVYGSRNPSYTLSQAVVDRQFKSRPKADSRAFGEPIDRKANGETVKARYSDGTTYEMTRHSSGSASYEIQSFLKGHKVGFAGSLMVRAELLTPSRVKAVKEIFQELGADKEQLTNISFTINNNFSASTQVTEAIGAESASLLKKMFSKVMAEAEEGQVFCVSAAEGAKWRSQMYEGMGFSAPFEAGGASVWPAKARQWCQVDAPPLARPGKKHQ